MTGTIPAAAPMAAALTKSVVDKIGRLIVLSVPMHFWRGFAVGIGALASAALLAFVVLLMPGLRITYGEFGGAAPAATRLVLGTAWAYAAPAGLVLALFATRFAPARRKVAAAIAMAMLALAVLGFTVWAAYAPMRAIAGQIRAE